MKRVRRRVLFWIISGLLIAMCAGSILLLRSIALPQRYKGLIEARLKAATGRDVWIRRASLRFLGGMGIEFEDLVIEDWDGGSDFIRTRNFILQMKILPLLRRQLRWKSLIIEEPSVWLSRSREGNINLWAKEKGLAPKGEMAYHNILGILSSFADGDIRVRKGSVHFVDNFVASRPKILRIEGLYIELGSISMNAPISFRVRARQPNPKGPAGSMMILGEIGPLPDPFEPSKIRVAAEVRAKNVNGHPIWPYYGPHIPMKGIEGFLDIHVQYEGDFSGIFQSWGKIRVKDVALDYPQAFDSVLKPQEFVLDYDVRMTMEELIVSDVRLRLPEIEIRGRGAITEIRSPMRRVEAFATTGSFQFDEVKHYIPLRILSPGFANFMREITRRGRGRIVELRIEGPVRDFSMLEYPEKEGLIYGKMRLDGMVYPFAKVLRPVENISGWVILEKGSLSFHDLKGYYGRSVVNAPEMIISRIYASPQLNLTVNGEIYAREISDIAKPGAFPGKGVPIGDISGRGDLQLSVAGRLSSSSRVSYTGHLAIEGTNLSVKGVNLPIEVTSGKVLFSNDRFRLIGLRGKVGKWRNTGFSNLTADITLTKDRLHLEGFNCGMNGGEVELTAWVDLDSEDGVAFTLNPMLSHVDVGWLFRDFGMQERVWITGAFNLWGSLMGRGHSEEDVRRSLEGKLRVRMGKGRIRRFHILSKIFSLLNVSQLLKGKLPELTGEGLPFNTITGEIEIAKGIAKTENLLVDSDAMKITIIGEADIARKSLDLTVGLQPLGTVDSIVSRVPVVGRILTGEDESIISYYVEVKGDFSNPEVKHIPLKSMEKGLIEIMRRLLETPKNIIPREKGGEG